MAEDQEAPPSAYLVRALTSDRPLGPSSRHWLDGIERVLVRRRDSTLVDRRGSELKLDVADARLSTEHFSIDVDVQSGEYTLRDLGSTNGTRVNGVAAQTHVLEDGDVIEAGRTFFVFREGSKRASIALDEEASPNADDRSLMSLATTLESTLLLATRLAASRVPVLLTAPTGTGKEVVARAIHRLSGRSGPFIAVNCAAIAPTLVESELFGHRRGAFSGATDDRPGLVRSSDGGTLLLDEIGDLPMAAQGSLLRVLQENEVMPIGGARAVPVDLRVVAATHRPVRTLVDEGRFRADLLARLAGYELTLPPLRERREDIGLLVGTFLLRHAGERAGSMTLATSAARALFTYEWPLNVRELERAIEAAVVLAIDGVIRPPHLPAAVLAERPASDAAQTDATPPDEAQAEQREELLRLLEEHDWNVSAVSRATGKARMQIQRWMKRYGLKRSPP